MNIIVIHTGGTVQLLAAGLLSFFLSKSGVSIHPQDVINIEHVKRKSNFYNGKDIVIIGSYLNGHDLIKLDVLSKAASVTIFNQHRNQNTLGDKFFKALPNTTVMKCEGVHNVDNILRSIEMFAKDPSTCPLFAKYSTIDTATLTSMPVPDIVAAITPEDNKALDTAYTDNLYRGLSVAAYTYGDALELIENPDEVDVVGQLVYAGRLLDRRHRDFVERALKDRRTIKMTELIKIKAVGTCLQYASCLAEAMLDVEIVGCAYYDTDDFRHFELRADPSSAESKGILSLITSVYEGRINEQGTAARIRIHRTSKFSHLARE